MVNYTIVSYERVPGVRPKEVFIMRTVNGKTDWLTAFGKWREWLGNCDKRLFVHPTRYSAYMKLLEWIESSKRFEKARVDFVPGDESEK